MIKIGIDIDNTIVNTTQTILNYINERLPDMNLEIADIGTYSIEDSLPEGYRWIVESAFEDRNMWKQIETIPHSIETISEWIEDDEIEVYFVTSCSPRNFYKKVKFLERQFPNVAKNCINIKNKSMLKLDFLIDDCLKNFDNADYFGLCLSYPWNRSVQHDNFIRVSDWRRIKTIIDQQKRKLKQSQEEIFGARTTRIASDIS